MGYPYNIDKAVFRCPEAPQDLPTYAMNRRLKDTVAITIDAPAQTVMLFDSIPGKNLAGGRSLVPNPFRHSGGHTTTIGFVDGHVKSVSVEDIPNLLWTPLVKTRSTTSQTEKDESSSNQAFRR